MERRTAHHSRTKYIKPCEAFYHVKDIIDFNCFEVVGEKGAGRRDGKIYKLKADHSEDPELYLIKFPYKRYISEYISDTEFRVGLVEMDHERYVREVIGDYVGPMLARAAGNNAPENYLVQGDHGKIFLCSKFIRDFKELDILSNQYGKDVISVETREKSYGIDITVNGINELVSRDLLHRPSMRIEGKPIENLEDTIVFEHFIQHRDRHLGNFGIIDKVDHYESVLIDYSEADMRGNEPYTMAAIGDIDRYKVAQDKILSLNIRREVEKAYKTIVAAFPHRAREFMNEKENVIKTLESRQQEAFYQRHSVDIIEHFINSGKYSSPHKLYKDLGISRGQLIDHPILGEVSVYELFNIQDEL